jgi:hypothetical protein
MRWLERAVAITAWGVWSTMAFGTGAAVVALGAMGCQNGFDREQATAECDADREQFENCVNQAAYDECIACHEQCGTDCSTSGNACPTKFTCPEDQ